MFARWWFRRTESAKVEKKPERPCIKICTQCSGKGQISYFNQHQEKCYGPCDKCSNGNGPYALGVCLKCRCQEPSVPYIYIASTEVKHYRNALGEADLRELVSTQQALGAQGTAVLLLCDECGARYICQDGAGKRRKISGTEEMNAEDKEFNRHIAATMVSHGILKELNTTDDGVVVLVHNSPRVGPLPGERPGSAVPAARVPVAPFGAVPSGGRLRPMSAPAYRPRHPALLPTQAPVPAPITDDPEEPLFQHMGLEATPPPTEPVPVPEVPKPEPPPEAPPAPPSPAPPRLRPQPNANNPLTPISVDVRAGASMV